MTSRVPHPFAWAAARAGSAVLALVAFAVAAPAAAQTPPASAPPPQPAPVNTPALLKPAVDPPPVAAPSRAAANRRPATFAPIRPAARVGLPVDSIRPAVAVAAKPPANAVAQCGDGTFIIAPATAGACSTHRGLRVMMPAATAPPPAATRAVSTPLTVQAAPVSATAPAGATMRCKDGAYLSGTPSGAACATHGGLAATLPAPRTPPPAPARARRP
jgi:hypothetical protein